MTMKNRPEPYVGMPLYSPLRKAWHVVDMVFADGSGFRVGSENVCFHRHFAPDEMSQFLLPSEPGCPMPPEEILAPMRWAAGRDEKVFCYEDDNWDGNYLAAGLKAGINSGYADYCFLLGPKLHAEYLRSLEVGPTSEREYREESVFSAPRAGHVIDAEFEGGPCPRCSTYMVSPEHHGDASCRECGWPELKAVVPATPWSEPPVMRTAPLWANDTICAIDGARQNLNLAGVLGEARDKELEAAIDRAWIAADEALSIIRSRCEID